jgi:hypothetical protein
MNQNYLKLFPGLRGGAILGSPAQVRTLAREWRSSARTEAEVDQLLQEMEMASRKPLKTSSAGRLTSRGSARTDKAEQLRLGIEAYKRGQEFLRMKRLADRRKGKVPKRTQARLAAVNLHALRIKRGL